MLRSFGMANLVMMDFGMPKDRQRFLDKRSIRAAPVNPFWYVGCPRDWKAWDWEDAVEDLGLTNSRLGLGFHGMVEIMDFIKEPKLLQKKMATVSSLSLWDSLRSQGNWGQGNRRVLALVTPSTKPQPGKMKGATSHLLYSQSNWRKVSIMWNLWQLGPLNSPLIHSIWPGVHPSLPSGHS